MPTTVENRVVEMEFDNKRFEANVKETMTSIEKLKEALTFKGLKSGFDEIEENSKKLNLSPLEKSVDTVKDKFSAMEIVAISALMRITNQAMATGERLVKSLTIDQAKAGFEKYAEKTQAVQTIMNATGESIDDVNKQLEKLSWFTDETSYSFTDMVSNIGKFTSNAVDLKTAVTAMQGISTWAAKSGANVQQASHAMYNLSQALAAGSVKKLDWKSIENANMSTAEFKQTAIDAAVELGVLQKAEDGVARSAKGNAVTIKTFTDTLQDSWFTTEVLLKSLDKYGDFTNKLYEVTSDTDLTASQMLASIDKFKNGTLDINKLSEDLGKSVEETQKIMEDLSSDTYDFGRKAFQAAQEAKTFREAIDATKEAVASGWMQTYEHIFGNYKEAVKLWTSVSNIMYTIFAERVNRRNSMLAEWKELANGGRGTLIDAISNSFMALWTAMKPVKEAFREIFPEMTANRLGEIVVKLRDFTSHLKISDVTAQNLKDAFKGLFYIFQQIGTAFVDLVKKGQPVFKLIGSITRLLIALAGAAGRWAQKQQIANKIFGVFVSVIKAGLTVIFSLAYGIVLLVSKMAELVSWLSEMGVFRIITTPVQILAGAIVFLYNSIKNLLGLSLTAIPDFIRSIDSKLSHLADQIMSFPVVQKTVQILATAFETISNLLTKIGAKIAPVWDFFKEVTDLIKQGEWQEAFTLVSDKLKEIVNSLKTMVVDGLFGGFKDENGNVLSAQEKLEQFNESLRKFRENLSIGKIVAIGFSVTMLALAASITRLSDSTRGVMDSLKSLITNGNKIMRSLATRTAPVRQFAEAIAIVSASLALLSTMDQEKLKSSAKYIAGIMAALALFATVITVLSRGSMKRDFRDFSKNINAVAIAVVALSVGVAALAASMLMLEHITIDGNTWKRMATIGVLMAGLVAAGVALSKWTPKLSAGGLVLILYALSVKKIVEALVAFNDIDITGLKDKVLSLISLMAGLAMLAIGMGQIKLSSVLGVLLLAATFKMVVPVFRDEVIPAIEALHESFVTMMENLGNVMKQILGVEKATQILNEAMKDLRRVIIAAMAVFAGLMATLMIFGNSMKNIGKGIGYLGVGLSVILLSIGAIIAIVDRNGGNWNAFDHVTKFLSKVLGWMTAMIAIAALFSGTRITKVLRLGGGESIFGQFAKMMKAMSFMFISIMAFTAVITMVASDDNLAAFTRAQDLVNSILALTALIVGLSGFAASAGGENSIKYLSRIVTVLLLMMGAAVVLSAIPKEDLEKAVLVLLGISTIFSLLMVTIGLVSKFLLVSKRFIANAPMAVIAIGSILALAGSIIAITQFSTSIQDALIAWGMLLSTFAIVTAVFVFANNAIPTAPKFVAVTEAISKAMLSLVAVAASITMLSALSKDIPSMITATIAIGALFAEVAIIMAKVTKTGKTAPNFITAAGAMAMATASLLIIASSIMLLTGFVDDISEATEAAWALGSLFAVVSMALAGIQAVTKGSASLFIVAGAVDAMCASFIIIAKALIMVKDYNAEDLKSKLQSMATVLGVVSAFVTIVGGLLGQSGVGWAAILGVIAMAGAMDMIAWSFKLTAQALDIAMPSMMKLPEFIKQMVVFSGEEIARVAGSLSDLAKVLKEYGKVGEKLADGAEGLTYGGEGLIAVAKGLYEIGEISLTPEEFAAFADSLSKLSTIGYSLIISSAGLLNAGAALGGISSGLAKISNSGVSAEEFSNWGDAFGKLGSAGASLIIGSLGLLAAGAAMTVLAGGINMLADATIALKNSEPYAVEGFVEGATSPQTETAMYNAGVSFALPFLTGAYETWGQHSPWSTTEVSVDYASLGMAQGVSNNVALMSKLGGAFASPFSTTFVTSMAAMAPTGVEGAVDGIKETVDENKDEVATSGKNTALEWLQGFWDGFKQGWNDTWSGIYDFFIGDNQVFQNEFKLADSLTSLSNGIKEVKKAYDEGGLTGVLKWGTDMSDSWVEALSGVVGDSGVLSGLKDLADEFGLVISDSNESMNDMMESLNSATSAYDDLGSSANKTKTFVEQLTDTIEQQMDVFTEFNSKTEITGEQMLNNMASQVSGVRQWAENLKYLAERGIDDGLLQKLTELGPAGYEKVAAFVNMTDDQLQMAGSLFQESLSLPESTSKEVSRDWWKTGEEAAGGFTQGITSPESTQAAEEAGKTIANVVRVELSKIIPDTIKTGKRTPEQLAKGIDANKDEAVKTAKFLGTSVVNAVDVIMNGGQNHQSGSPYIGKMFVKGLVDGMNSESKNLVTAASLKANTLMYAMRKTLDEHSPSKEAFKIGDFFIRGLILGLQSDDNLIKRTSEESAANIMDAFGQTLMATEAYSFSPTVRPVLDLDSFNQDYSKFSSIMDAGYSKNLSGSMHTYASFDDSLLNALENLGDNSDVVDEVKALSGRIADMTQQIGKMQVVLDSGTMVGALVTPLDQALGNKAIRSRRERR